jgi:hypothetical protein
MSVNESESAYAKWRRENPVEGVVRVEVHDNDGGGGPVRVVVVNDRLPMR